MKTEAEIREARDFVGFASVAEGSAAVVCSVLTWVLGEECEEFDSFVRNVRHQMQVLQKQAAARSN